MTPADLPSSRCGLVVAALLAIVAGGVLVSLLLERC